MNFETGKVYSREINTLLHCTLLTSRVLVLLILQWVTYLWVKSHTLHGCGDLDFQKAYTFQISYPNCSTNKFTFIRLCVLVRNLGNMAISLVSKNIDFLTPYELKYLPKFQICPPLYAHSLFFVISSHLTPFQNVQLCPLIIDSLLYILNLIKKSSTLLFVLKRRFSLKDVTPPCSIPLVGSCIIAHSSHTAEQ